MKTISAYAYCPNCDESTPATFTFDALSDASEETRIRCSNCGTEFGAELYLVPQVCINGDDTIESEFYVRD